MKDKKVRSSRDDLVSVVVPTFNSSRFVLQAVESILEQTYTNLEVLITDDCSTDNTWEIVSELAGRDARIKLCRRPSNGGAAAARNDAIERASGRYLAFLDSDDIWLPNKLDTQIELLNRTQTAMVFAPYFIIDESGRHAGFVVDYDVPDVVSYEDMLNKRATMGCLTVVIDCGRVPKVSMPAMRAGQDYATWLSILRQGHVAVRTARPLALYRIVRHSISRNKWNKARQQWAIYRECENLSRIRAARCFVSYALNALTAKKRCNEHATLGSRAARGLR